MRALSQYFYRILSRRPFKSPAAQQVKVQMIDRLPAVRAAIIDDSETVFSKFVFNGQFVGWRFECAASNRFGRNVSILS
jgi:hypothetical protein